MKKKVFISSSIFFLVSLGINIYLLWTQKMADYVLLALLDSSLIFTLFIGYWATLNSSQITSLSNTSNGGFQEVGNPPLPDSPKETFSKFGLYANILLLFVAIGVVTQQSIKTTQTNINKEALYRRMLSDIQLLHLENANQKALIISPAFGIPWEWSNPLFLDFPQPQYLVMGWDTFSPAYESVLHEYQIESLPEGLYEKKNIYLMTDETTMNGILKFIQFHKKVDVIAQLIYTPNLHTGIIYDESRLYKLEEVP